MGNNRGNIYSDRHKTLDNKSYEYWDFDFEEMGVYDVPAMMEYITNATNQTHVNYVGHSEGNTQMFIGSSLLPTYFKGKVDLFVALAPVVRLDNTSNKAFLALS